MPGGNRGRGGGQNLAGLPGPLFRPEPGIPAMYKTRPMKDETLREEFYRDLNNQSFDYVIKKYFPMPSTFFKVKNKLRSVVKPILKPILNVIRKKYV